MSYSKIHSAQENGGERGIGLSLTKALCKGSRPILSGPGEGLIRTALGLF